MFSCAHFDYHFKEMFVDLLKAWHLQCKRNPNCTGAGRIDKPNLRAVQIQSDKKNLNDISPITFLFCNFNHNSSMEKFFFVHGIRINKQFSVKT